MPSGIKVGAGSVVHVKERSDRRRRWRRRSWACPVCDELTVGADAWGFAAQGAIGLVIGDAVDAADRVVQARAGSVTLNASTL